MPGPIEFEIRHTADGVRRVARAFWNARHRRAYWTSMAVAVLLMTVALGTRSLAWWLAVPLTVVILHAAVLSWQRQRVTALQIEQLERAQPPVFRYRLDGETVAESSPLGNVEMPWSSFAGICELDAFLLLLRAPLASEAYIAFPLDQLPPAARAALHARFPG